jgi:Zn-dependent peptidase ImmA (M78 family)
MTELSALYRHAEQLNIPVFHLPLPQTGSVSMMDEQGRCAIGLDLPHRRTRTERRVRLAHELGHCATGSFYNRWSPADIRRLHENRADKYAVRLLISPEDLDEAVAEGFTEPWELAEHFGVDETFLKKAVCLYTYGNLAAELYF